MKRSKRELHHLLRLLWSGKRAVCLFPLDTATYERWGGLSGFGEALLAGEAGLEDVIPPDSEMMDGFSIGFSWGYIVAAARLAGTDFANMCIIAADVIAAVDPEDLKPDPEEVQP